MLTPDVILADEPTGNLDAHTGEAVHELLQGVNQQKGITFVIVTHNDKLAIRADRVSGWLRASLCRNVERQNLFFP